MTIDTARKTVEASRTDPYSATDIQQALAGVAAGVSLRSVTKKYGSVTADNYFLICLDRVGSICN